MYEFTGWCFLCAREQDVDVEIKSLAVEIQEKISEFSIVNFNIMGCPSKICSICFKFLNDTIYYTKRYETIEKFYIELLKNKNKNFNIRELKAKYEIEDVIVESPPKKGNPLQSPKRKKIQVSSVQIIQKQVDTSPSPTSINFDSFEPPEFVDPPSTSEETFKTPVIIQKKQIPQKSLQKPAEKSHPKILNPTILPKIENKLRLHIITCDLCSHKTSTLPSLEKHMESHIKNEKMFECKVCQKKFSKKQILTSHELTHKISADRKTFQCKECGKHLSSRSALNSHMKWYHEEKDFKCNICLKNFATKGSLKEHLKIHSSIKQHVCPICSNAYKTASTLSNHLDTHSNTVYECFQCGLKLNSKRTLKQHEKVHSTVTEHVCNICGAEFKRIKAFKEHLIIHSNIRPYKCDFCEKTFTNGPNCRKHKKEVHPIKLEEAEKKGNKQKTVKLPNLPELLAMSALKSALE